MVDFRNKKIAVLGLGIEGEDVCRYLLAHGAKNITVFDQKTAEELKESTSNIQYPISNLKLGPSYLKDGLTGFDIIFRSPAFKPAMPEIAAAKTAGATVTSATKLFFDLCPGKIIGVTGTKGKGTTATLIYEILKQAGKKVFLAGNIGEPMLALLPKITQDCWVVLELSSFQLMDMDKSPHMAVVLFITSEHLDYHRDTNEYIQAKSNIMRHQTKSDLAVLNHDNQNSASFAKLTKANVFYFSCQQKTNGSYVVSNNIYLENNLIGKTNKLKLLGTHNYDNVGAAITAGNLAGADLRSIKKVIFSFTGLEHRLEKVKTLNGVSFYNDSFSTTPETTIAAIKSFKQPLILICGGSEKGSDYLELGKQISRGSIKTLILIGDMAEKIKKATLGAGFKCEIVCQPKNMQEIVKIAFKKSKKGDVVLLSPACASFGMFKNYKERGQQFKKYVQAFKSHP